MNTCFFLLLLSENETTHMERLWNELNERLSWPIVNRILNRKELPTGRGKDNTFESLQAHYASSADNRENFDSLAEELTEAILYCDKYLKYFEFAPEVIQECLDRINIDYANFERNSNIGLNFPLTDEDYVIEESSLNRPELIRIIRRDSRIYLIYSTIRNVKTRESLRDRFNNIEGADFVNDYTSVYGEIVIPTQFFDIIRIDSNRNVIEFSIDNHKDQTLRQLESNYVEIVNIANMLFSGLSVNFTRAHNFYSMLRRLYDDSAQGKVKEMAFITDSDSLKHEKMNYTNGVDLRRDSYHEQGKVGVSLDFYRLGLSWERTDPFQNTIYMAVLGKYHMLRYQDGAYINEAFVRACHSSDEYYFIIGILRQYS